MQWILLYSTLHYSSSFEQLFFRQIVKVRVRVEEHIILLSKATVNAIWLVKWTKHVLKGAMCEKNTDNIFTWNDDALVGSAGVNVAHGGGDVDTDCGLQWKLMIHFHTVTGLATEHWMVQSCAQQWPLARYLVTWCDGLIWWRHSGSLQCSANTNKDTFLSRSCVYLELYFIIT